MIHELDFIYMDCQTCAAKVHCDQCQERAAEMLMRAEGISGVEINMAIKHISVETEGIDAADLEDILEEAGIFIQ